MTAAALSAALGASVDAPADAATANVPLIELTDVTKTYRNGPLSVEVLHGLSLRIFPGEFVAIMGTSGSGKSTLMNILGCLDKPTTGEYRFKGEDVSGFDRDQLATLRREAFGFVFQSYNLIAGSTAVENVEVPAIYAGMAPADRHAHAAELLTSLGLGERLHHQPNQLSGGQQQRVSIARALMNGGQIILADEPTGALDTRSGVEVMERLKALSRAGHTVILITHDPDVASQAQRVIEVRDGRILSDPGPTPHDEAPPVVTGRSGAPSFSAQALESAKMALRALRSNIFRSVLTLLGIVIGVGSVIAMLAIGNGAKQEVVDRISGMGSNLLLIRPGAPNTRGNGIVSLVLSDAETLNDMPNVLAAVPENTGGVTARYGNADYQTQVTATSANFPVARNWPVVRGTFFAKEDVDEYAAVAVLGQTVADVLFPGVDPIGSHLVLNNVLFQVIGVMAVRGASPMGQDQDDAVLVPITTGNLRLFGQRSLRTLTVAVADTTRIDDTQDAVSALLQERHGVVDFQIRNMASLIETMSQTQNTLTILLGSIAAISLLVGGIGVMNIMLVSVTERTREIGIRMATGARSRNIQQQFLIEAVVVSAIGGAIGVVGGLATAGVIQLAGTPIQLTLAPVVLAFGCAFATGLVFGWLPARKASGLDPVVALSSE